MNEPDPIVTDQVADFMAALPQWPDQPTRAIIEAVDYVAAKGPSARRPVLAEVNLHPDYPGAMSLFGHRLREIRPLGTNVRILCTFRDGTLVLLWAGDKAGAWKAWYGEAIEGARQAYAALDAATRGR